MVAMPIARAARGFRNRRAKRREIAKRDVRAAIWRNAAERPALLGPA
jgi:hypothetical protein